MRKKLYGFNYRLLNKTIHRLDFCRLKYNTALAKRSGLGARWVVPGNCSWCGSRNTLLCTDNEFRKRQKQNQRERDKIARLFST